MGNKEKINDILKYLKLGYITDYNYLVINLNKLNNSTVIDILYNILSTELLIETKSE